MPIMLPSTPKSWRLMVACVVSRMPPSPTGVTLAFSASGFVVPLMVSCARRSTVSPSIGVGAGDDDADVGELLGVEEVGGAQMLVALADSGLQRRRLDVDAAENRLRGGDLAVPLNSVKRPLTGTRPHIDLAFTATVDWSGTTRPRRRPMLDR